MFLVFLVACHNTNTQGLFGVFLVGGGGCLFGFFHPVPKEGEQPKPQSVKTQFPSVNKRTAEPPEGRASTPPLLIVRKIHEKWRQNKHTHTHTNIRLGLITGSEARGKVNLSGGLISIPQFKTLYNSVVGPEAGRRGPGGSSA